MPEVPAMPGVEGRRGSQDPPTEEHKPCGYPGRGSPPRLCGYLAKLSGKGPLRSFKSRWFVFDPRRCHLYYFKSPQDSQPVGHIDIGDASFSYDLEAEEGQFEIHSSGRVSILRATSRQAMTWWLQELQQKRWEYCNSRRTGGKRDSMVNPSAGQVPTGLVAKESSEITPVPGMTDSAERARIHFTADMCPGALGDQTADHGSSQSGAVQGLLRQWSNDIRGRIFQDGGAHEEFRTDVGTDPRAPEDRER